uniref:Uncharacterized protein n=1 Tax=Strigamia maritima TaxID=126957 RepID=T1ITR5_STRMM
MQEQARHGRLKTRWKNFEKDTLFRYTFFGNMQKPIFLVERTLLKLLLAVAALFK